MKLIEEIFNPKYKLYVDLDGVLVNFEGGVEKLIGGPIHEGNNKKVFWKTIRKMPEDEVVDFWAGLDWTPDGPDLWRSVVKYEPIILSSPGSSLRELIEKAKTKWIEKNLKPRPKQVIYEREKWVYASPQAILIDDMAKQVNPWRENGGIALHHAVGKARETVSKLTDLFYSSEKV